MNGFLGWNPVIAANLPGKGQYNPMNHPANAAITRRQTQVNNCVKNMKTIKRTTEDPNIQNHKGVQTSIQQCSIRDAVVASANKVAWPKQWHWLVSTTQAHMDAFLRRQAKEHLLNDSELNSLLPTTNAINRVYPSTPTTDQKHWKEHVQKFLQCTIYMFLQKWPKQSPVKPITHLSVCFDLPVDSYASG